MTMEGGKRRNAKKAEAVFIKQVAEATSLPRRQREGQKLRESRKLNIKKHF